MSIYVNFEIPKTPQDFLLRLYSNVEYNKAHCVATYSDKDCKLIQCYENKLRSFDDLFEIFTTYYPELTEKDLIEILVNGNIKSTTGKQLYLHTSNCSTIMRIRIFYYNDVDECTYYYNCKKYDSKYSWVELFAMIGINSRMELRDYLLKNIK